MAMPISTAVTKAAASQSRTIFAAVLIIVAYLAGATAGKQCDYFRDYFGRDHVPTEIVPK